MSDTPKPEDGHGLKDKISGLGQKIIGEIESLGGILTADPATAAEGEFNVEVGTVREELEDEIGAADKGGGDRE